MDFQVDVEPEVKELFGEFITEFRILNEHIADFKEMVAPLLGFKDFKEMVALKVKDHRPSKKPAMNTANAANP